LVGDEESEIDSEFLRLAGADEAAKADESESDEDEGCEHPLMLTEQQQRAREHNQQMVDASLAPGCRLNALASASKAPPCQVPQGKAKAKAKATANAEAKAKRTAKKKKVEVKAKPPARTCKKNAKANRDAETSLEEAPPQKVQKVDASKARSVADLLLLLLLLLLLQLLLLLVLLLLLLLLLLVCLVAADAFAASVCRPQPP
jgi:hypothetical protein